MLMQDAKARTSSNRVAREVHDATDRHSNNHRLMSVLLKCLIVEGYRPVASAALVQYARFVHNFVLSIIPQIPKTTNFKQRLKCVHQNMCGARSTLQLARGFDNHEYIYAMFRHIMPVKTKTRATGLVMERF